MLFADGVDESHLPWFVEALPTLLHLSLFLFFAGLLVFLFTIHHTVFIAVVWWVGLSVGIYGYFTLMPMFRPDSPYYAPLSSPALMVYTGVSYGILCLLNFIRRFCYFETWWRFHYLTAAHRERPRWGGAKTAQEITWASKAEIDRSVFRRTINALDDDDDLEWFFECIPDFCSSKEVDDPKRILAEMDDPEFTEALIQFWDHTLKPSFVSENVKKRRLATCVKAADSACPFGAAWGILQVILGRGMDGVLQSVEVVHSLGSRVNNNNEGSALCTQGIVSGIIASAPVEKRDGRWKALVMD